MHPVPTSLRSRGVDKVQRHPLTYRAPAFKERRQAICRCPKSWPRPDSAASLAQDRPVGKHERPRKPFCSYSRTRRKIGGGVFPDTRTRCIVAIIT